MREKLISLVVVSVFFTFLFLVASSFTGTVVYEGPAKLSDQYKDVTSKEVYSCHDRTTLGIGQVRVIENTGHLRTVFVSDVCVDKKTLRTFACKWENGKHFLISADVNCEEQRLTCKRDRCR